MPKSVNVKSLSHALQAAAQATTNPILIGVINAIEEILNEIVQDPTAKIVLQAIEAWINSIIGGAPPVNPTLTAMHKAAAGPIIQLLLKLVENLITGMAGNPAILQAIIAFIQQILGNLPQPTP